LSGRTGHRAAVGVKALFLALCLGAASPAQAQIYSWRDANGHLVLSNQRPTQAGEVKSYAVPKTTAVRATRYARAERSKQYDELIAEHADRNGVRSDLVRAVVQVESAFNPNARSPKGAMGLMQLMPATAQEYGVLNPFNPMENIRAGVQYLRRLLERFGHNEELALAAYNAGPTAVGKYGNTVPPYRETRNYVAQINQMTARPAEARPPQLYKVIDIVDGRPVPRYTDRKPASGAFELVSR
jgi:soluble lytic murein transglycosylase-like protein